MFRKNIEMTSLEVITCIFIIVGVTVNISNVIHGW